LAIGATGSSELAYRVGLITARQAREIGIGMTFSPVLDVNSNPSNPIINVRSFGENPEAVASLGESYIRGCRDGGLMTTAKHYPGHGDTGVDSHTDLPVINKEMKELENTELLPFRKAIEAGVDAVMVGHLSVPTLDSTGTPASLSSSIMRVILRDQMGFTGLVVTDALIMDALKGKGNQGSICRQALSAGADILLMPNDVSACVDSIAQAVKSGIIEEKLIDEPVRRILQAKEPAARSECSPEPSGKRMSELVVDGELTARELARKSITLLSNRGELIPIDEGRKKVFSITVRGDTLLPHPTYFHRIMEQELGESYRYLSVQPGSDSLLLEKVVSLAAQADYLLIIAVSKVRAYMGYPGLPSDLISLVENITSPDRTVLVSMGNPYIIGNLPEAPGILLAYGTDRHSQRAAAGAILGKSEIGGKLPVTIPDRFEYGFGLPSKK
jgi:beta-N-acetylhexosaminidase